MHFTANETSKMANVNTSFYQHVTEGPEESTMPVACGQVWINLAILESCLSRVLVPAAALVLVSDGQYHAQVLVPDGQKIIIMYRERKKINVLKVTLEGKCTGVCCSAQFDWLVDYCTCHMTKCTHTHNKR